MNEHAITIPGIRAKLTLVRLPLRFSIQFTRHNRIIEIACGSRRGTLLVPLWSWWASSTAFHRMPSIELIQGVAVDRDEAERAAITCLRLMRAWTR